jgi:hypothetical protein
MEAALHSVVRLMDSYLDTLSRQLDAMEGWVHVAGGTTDAASPAAGSGTTTTTTAGGVASGGGDAAETSSGGGGVVSPAQVSPGAVDASRKAERRAAVVAAARRLALELLPATVPVPQPGQAEDGHVFAKWLRDELRRRVDTKLDPAGAAAAAA